MSPVTPTIAGSADHGAEPDRRRCRTAVRTRERQSTGCPDQRRNVLECRADAADDPLDDHSRSVRGDDTGGRGHPVLTTPVGCPAHGTQRDPPEGMFAEAREAPGQLDCRCPAQRSPCRPEHRVVHTHQGGPGSGGHRAPSLAAPTGTVRSSTGRPFECTSLRHRATQGLIRQPAVRPRADPWNGKPSGPRLRYGA
jgi:hypothetical protein